MFLSEKGSLSSTLVLVVVHLLMNLHDKIFILIHRYYFHSFKHSFTAGLIHLSISRDRRQAGNMEYVMNVHIDMHSFTNSLIPFTFI